MLWIKPIEPKKLNKLLPTPQFSNNLLDSILLSHQCLLLQLMSCQSKEFLSQGNKCPYPRN